MAAVPQDISDDEAKLQVYTSDKEWHEAEDPSTEAGKPGTAAM